MAILIPTPIVGKVVSAIFGFFFWLAAWGITDAIVHGIAMDMSYKYFEIVRQNQLGMAAIMMFQGSDMKSIAAFGAIRWFGIMLATVLTQMIVNFGGQAMAQMAGQLSGMTQAGAGEGSSVVDPSRNVALQNQMAGVKDNIARAEMMWKYGDTFSMGEMVAAKKNAMWREMGSNLAYGSEGNAFNTGRIQTQSSVGGAQGLEEISSELGMSVEDIARYGGHMQGINNAATGEALMGFGHKSAMKAKMQGAMYDLANNQTLGEVVNKHFDGDFSELAKQRFSQDAATRQTFGNAENYEKFLKANQELNIGQQQGLIKAADTLGWDLKKWGEHTSEFDAMKKSGVLDKFDKGEISGETLKELGEFGYFTQKGQMDGKQWLADHYFKGSVENMEEHLGKFNGMDTITKLDEMKNIASKVGGMENLMRAKNRMGSYSFSDKEANALGLEKGGEYHLAWGKNGGVGYFSRHSGSQTQDGSFGKSGSSHELVDKNTISIALDHRDLTHKELFDNLKSSGKNVQWGDMVNATYTSSGELSTWDIRRGGELIASNYELNKEGKKEIIDDNVTQKTVGTTVSGAANYGAAKIISKMSFGYIDQKGAEELVGTVQGTAKEVTGMIGGLKGHKNPGVKGKGNASLGKGGGDPYAFDGDY